MRCATYQQRVSTHEDLPALHHKAVSPCSDSFNTHTPHFTLSFSCSLFTSSAKPAALSCSFRLSNPSPLHRSSSLGTKPSARASLASSSARPASAADSFAARASRSCCSFRSLALPCSMLSACDRSCWHCCREDALRASSCPKAWRRRLRADLRQQAARVACWALRSSGSGGRRATPNGHILMSCL
jgi:hypothetical protein